MDRTSHTPSRRESDEIVILDRELISCYMRFSEESLEEKEDASTSAPEELQFSSPVSLATAADEEIGDSSGISNSTTKTTPLRHDMLQDIQRNTIPPTLFADFERALEEADLPRHASDYYHWQGRRILDIGGTILPPDSENVFEEDPDEPADLFANLVSSFECSYDKIDAQVQNISYIQTLAPFTVKPTPEHMWVIYKQMAELVIKHTSIPSKGELTVLSALARLYDAHVYQPACTIPSLDPEITAHLHLLYDKLMRLLAKYQEWCRAMRDLTRNHMRPALQTVVDLPGVMQEVFHFDALQDAAEKAIASPDNPGLRPVSQEVLQAIQKSTATRRKTEARPQNFKGRTRFRREHTV